MTPDDNVPSDDATANAARHALHQLGGAQPIDLSWGEVQGRARRVKQQRLSVLGAACAIVLVGAALVVTTVSRHDGDNVRVAGGEQPIASISEPTSTTTLPYDSSSAAPTTPDGSAPVPGTASTPVPIDGPVALQPQDGSWSASMSVDAEQTTAGDYVTVHAELKNTGTQPQQTEGYGSLAITCARWLPTVEAAPAWPVGEFLESITMTPGETRSFSMTFLTDPQQVGEATCTLGVAFHGDAPWATDFPGLQANSVTIKIVASPASSTTTSSTTAPETTTTITP